MRFGLAGSRQSCGGSGLERFGLGEGCGFRYGFDVYADADGVGAAAQDEATQRAYVAVVAAPGQGDVAV